MRYEKTTFNVMMPNPEPHLRQVDCYAIKVPKWKPLKLCVHKEQKGSGTGSKWSVSEMTVGLCVSRFSYPTREQAIKDALERLQEEGWENVMKVWEAAKAFMPKQ